MTESDIVCTFCNGEIVEYFDDHYKGRRGKCPSCRVDFPLE